MCHRCRRTVWVWAPAAARPGRGGPGRKDANDRNQCKPIQLTHGSPTDTNVGPVAVFENPARLFDDPDSLNLCSQGESDGGCVTVSAGLTPSPPRGERAGVRGRTETTVFTQFAPGVTCGYGEIMVLFARPLTPALSPEYGGEGVKPVPPDQSRTLTTRTVRGGGMGKIARIGGEVMLSLCGFSSSRVDS